MAKKAIDRFSIRYTAFKNYVRFAHRLFYRRMHVKFQDNIPRGRSVLLAPNHQNALMDAMAPLMTSRRDTVFLTRADVFNNRFIAGIFRLFKMLPVYRIRDGASELSKNEEIFNESMEVLLRKKCPVAIFPEGNHGDKRRLRPLVKGIFRIAFQAQEKYREKPGVVIVPVGIDYSAYSNFRGNLFIQFGKGIEVNGFWAEYQENQARAINALRERLSLEMKKYIIDIQSEEHYDTYMMLRKVYNRKMRERLGFRKKDLYHRLKADQYMIRELARVEGEQPEKMSVLSEKVSEYSRGVESFRMRDWVFRRSRHSLLALILASLGMLISLPVFLAGTLTHILPYWGFDKLSLRIKDTQFRSTIKFVAGVFLIPFYYLILFIPVWIFTEPGWLKWVFLGGLLPAGLFAHVWYIWLKKLSSLWRYRWLTLTGNSKLTRINELRKQICDLAGSLIADPEEQGTGQDAHPV
jgi:1-acyl-sn-glycerol-3-phosphate acyltransferase